MNSIFELENRLDINKEFEKLVYAFHMDPNAAIFAEDSYHQRDYNTVMEAIDKRVFLKWKYRDIFLGVGEYLEHIGIDYEDTCTYGGQYIDEKSFLYYLEFLSNMFLLVKEDKSIELLGNTLAAIENIPRILEKMNYKLKQIDDKIIITKRDSNVDSILKIVNKEIADILLEYNDFRIENDIEAKKSILKELDLYIEKNINIKSFDKELDNAIGVIVNKMGINHPIKEEPYKNFTDKELIKWYDNCFVMMIHAIRTVQVNKIKNERKQLLNN